METVVKNYDKWEAWKNWIVVFWDVLAMHIFYGCYYSYCVSAIGAAFWTVSLHICGAKRCLEL